MNEKRSSQDMIVSSRQPFHLAADLRAEAAPKAAVDPPIGYRYTLTDTNTARQHPHLDIPGEQPPLPSPVPQRLDRYQQRIHPPLLRDPSGPSARFPAPPSSIVSWTFSSTTSTAATPSPPSARGKRSLTSTSDPPAYPPCYKRSTPFPITEKIISRPRQN
jgi:hypothetical protein